MTGRRLSDELADDCGGQSVVFLGPFRHACNRRVIAFSRNDLFTVGSICFIFAEVLLLCTIYIIFLAVRTGFTPCTYLLVLERRRCAWRMASHEEDRKVTGTLEITGCE